MEQTNLYSIYQRNYAEKNHSPTLIALEGRGVVKKIFDCTERTGRKGPICKREKGLYSHGRPKKKELGR